MKKRIRLVLTIVLGILLPGMVVWEYTRRGEPCYEGKPVTAWIKALGLGSGSYGISLSQGGKSASVRLLRAQGTNPAVVLPRSMQPRSGITNVYVFEDDARAVENFIGLQALGVIASTNAMVGLGTHTKSAGIPGVKSSRFLPPGISPPGPVASWPGLNWIHVYQDDRTDQQQAIQALQAIGPSAKPYLARAMRRQNSVFRPLYLEVYPIIVRYGGRKIPEPDADAAFTRQAVVNALGQLTNGVELMRTELLAALKDRDAQVRHGAVCVLDPVSDRDVQVLTALREHLRGMAPLELVRLAEGAQLRGAAAIQGLTVALKDHDAEARQQAAVLLGRIGPKSAAAIPVLLSALKDENRYVRGRSCQALGEIKGEARSVIPGLIQALDDPDAWVRGNAAEALGTYGAAAKTAVPRLTERQASATGVERYCLGKALGQIDPHLKGSNHDSQGTAQGTGSQAGPATPLGKAGR